MQLIAPMCGFSEVVSYWLLKTHSERLKFAVLFTIACMFWVRNKQDKCMLSEDTN